MNKILVFKWPIAAVLVLLTGKVFDIWPQLAQQLYYNGLFQVVRVVYDFTLGLLPMPMVYILFLLLVFLIYRYLGVLHQLIKKRKFGLLILGIVNFLSVVIILFYLLWGYNYHLPKVSQTLVFEPHQLTIEELYLETARMDSLLASQRTEAIGDSSYSINDIIIPGDLEDLLRESQEEVLSTWGYPTYGRVRIRKLSPKGILLRISTAGVYIPFVCEGHIDKGLHPIQWPFTMAHEMAHGYGITDEGECNFLGFVTCMNADHPLIRYSAYLSYYRYLINNLRRADNEKYKSLISGINPGVRNDINAIVEQLSKYPDIIPEFRDLVYDSYLKSHGVKDGLASYSTIIKLIGQWKTSGRDSVLIRRTFPWLAHE
jgi:hypothetical protein